MTHCALHALGIEEALVDGVYGVVQLHITLPLQENGPGVQPIVGPEHCEPALLIAMDQCPRTGQA